MFNLGNAPAHDYEYSDISDPYGDRKENAKTVKSQLEEIEALNAPSKFETEAELDLYNNLLSLLRDVSFKGGSGAPVRYGISMQINEIMNLDSIKNSGLWAPLLNKFKEALTLKLVEVKSSDERKLYQRVLDRFRKKDEIEQMLAHRRDYVRGAVSDVLKGIKRL